MSKEEICALCLQKKPLQESHLIPKFVGKWLKRTGTGHLVSATDGSKRIQDLVKIKLLCWDCEQKFSKFETYFAGSIFYPYVNDKIKEFDYNEKLKPFIISTAWRTLQLFKEDVIKDVPPHLLPFVDTAEKEWRESLNGDGDSMDNYETHMVLLDYVKPETSAEVDPKFHWYLLRGTDATIGYTDDRVYFFVKLPWIAFVISIEPKKLKGWEGTIVNKSGHITTGQNVRDGAFGAFLNSRAKLALYSSKGPSDEIGEKRLLKFIQKDPEKYLTSHTYEAQIVERDNIRRIKMKNMPVSLIELVEEGILDGHTGPDIELVESQANKMITRLIADKIANLSEDDATRLHEMIYTVNVLSQIPKENKQMTFASDSLHITYMVSYETDSDVQVETVKKAMVKLKEETQDKIPYAVFSYSPVIRNYITAYFVPRVADSK